MKKKLLKPVKPMAKRIGDGLNSKLSVQIVNRRELHVALYHWVMSNTFWTGSLLAKPNSPVDLYKSMAGCELLDFMKRIMVKPEFGEFRIVISKQTACAIIIALKDENSPILIELKAALLNNL